MLIVNGIGGISNVFWVVNKNFTIWNIVVLTVNLLILYLVHKDFSSVVVALLTYPLGLFTPIWVKKMEFFENFNFESEGELMFRSSRYLDTIPLKAVAELGNTSQKKTAILEIESSLKNGANMAENMKILNKFLSDKNQDVALYASEAINEIESYYVEEIAKLEHSTNPKDAVEFCYKVLNILETNLIVGRLLDYYKRILSEKAEIIKTMSLIDYYIIMYKSTSDIRFLENGFEVTSSEKILKMLFTEYLKKKMYAESKKLAREFPYLLDMDSLEST